MKRVPLTNRDFFCLVSDEDFEFLSRFSWYAKESRRGEYACTSIRVGDRVFTLRMHRLVMRCFDDKTVDHLNGMHFDNQQENLEIVSMLENVGRYGDKHDDIPF